MILEPGISPAPPQKTKKWQSRKDSNLNKMNQNHLCYRYTTGLRTVYNIRPEKKNASKNLKNFAFFCGFFKKTAFTDCKNRLLRYILECRKTVKRIKYTEVEYGKDSKIHGFT